jgi:hypothetical protein
MQIDNGSILDLRDVGIIRRLDNGQLESSWIGELKPKTAAPLAFHRMGPDGLRLPQWNDSPVTSPGGAADGELKLDRLIDLAVDRLQLLPGETRLIGWTDMRVPGVRYDPEASQAVRRTMVLVHLEQGALPELKSDLNLKIDLESAEEEDENLSNVSGPQEPPLPVP